MEFSVHGWFPVPTYLNNGRHVDREGLRDFWECDVGWDLADALGCYVFGLRQGRGITPFYVGMTARLSFESECFSAQNQVKLSSILGRHGRLVLFLLKEERSRRSSPKAIRELEAYLIGVAADRNPDGLLNLQGRSRPSWVIQGVGEGRGRGRRDHATTEFVRMLGL